MKALVKYLILGLNLGKNRPFSREEDIKEAIMDDFKVTSHKIDKINMFERV